MTLGQRLHNAREANGMSIGDVARRTYIQPKFIQAIEQDDLTIVPESHRRLFVREFAKCVGVAADELLQQLPEYSPPPPPAQPEPVDAEARRPLWQRSTHAPPASNLSDGDRKTYSDFLNRLSQGGGIKLGGTRLTTWLIGSAVGLLLLVGAYYIFFNNKGGHSQGAGSADSAGTSTRILSRGDGEGEGDSVAADAGTPGAADDSLTLEGRATAKIWFAIVMDGKRSETGTMDSGSVRTWRAAETFKLSLGNAGGLQLSLNERKLGALGPLRTSIRNQTIDANGVRRATPGRKPATAAPAAPPPAAPVQQAPATRPAAKPAVRPATAPKPATTTRPAATTTTTRTSTTPAKPSQTTRKPRRPARQSTIRLLTPTEIRTAQPPQH